MDFSASEDGKHNADSGRQRWNWSSMTVSLPIVSYKILAVPTYIVVGHSIHSNSTNYKHRFSKYTSEEPKWEWPFTIVQVSAEVPQIQVTNVQPKNRSCESQFSPKVGKVKSCVHKQAELCRRNKHYICICGWSDCVFVVRNEYAYIHSIKNMTVKHDFTTNRKSFSRFPNQCE